jgi:hypothetical protein
MMALCSLASHGYRAILGRWAFSSGSLVSNRRRHQAIEVDASALEVDASALEVDASALTVDDTIN